MSARRSRLNGFSRERVRAAESPRFESVLGSREDHRPATYGQLVTGGESAAFIYSDRKGATSCERGTANRARKCEVVKLGVTTGCLKCLWRLPSGRVQSQHGISVRHTALICLMAQLG